MKKLASILLSVLMVLSLCACGQKAATENAPTWQEQYDLGVKYLSEGNYEEAIIAFTAAIEIDPKRPEAYLDMAYAYIGQNDFDSARDILERGYELTQDAALKEKLDELDSGNVTDYAGNERKLSCYDADGILLYYHIYTYDTRNRQTSVTSFDGAGSQTGHVDLSYNVDGTQAVGYGISATDGAVMKAEMEYDGSGNCVHEVWYDPDGELSHYTIYAYDAQGHETRMESYFADGELYEIGTYAYDAQGHMIRQEYSSPDGVVYCYITYTYDAQGHMAETCQYFSGTLERRSVSHYDEDGNYIGSEEYDGNGVLTSSTVYE